jgi:DNA-binding SARP family transcriptional activator/tetratricopeptide (TPR) repeat protein
MRLGILGPLQVVDGERTTAVAGRNLRILLAVLLCQPNRAVSAAALLEAIWCDAPPRTAGKNLHVYVHRLRQALGADRVLTYPHGYGFAVGPGELDADTFDRLTGEAAEAAGRADLVAGRSLLDQALGLWRGPALADLDDVPALAETTARLNEQRWNAFEDLMEIELALGLHARVAATLEGLVVQHPLRERMRGQLMVALYRSGRQADALAHYHAGRDALVNELGVEPAERLQNIHLSILRGVDPGLERVAPQPAKPDRGSPADSPVSGQPSRHVPRQLPAPSQLFTGRVTELGDLGTIHDASTVVITAIDGMAGVGKTALAVQAAHQMADRYPDGQLFIDLHGYTHGVAPVEPGDALDRILRSLGVAGERIPVDVDERAALYRSWLADRRMVIVLDNAATEAQVTPLLPGAPGCVVLVTSRRRLAGLDQTHTLSLDTLPAADAAALLRNTAGESRLAGQPPDVVAELVELCGLLPLAVRIAAARLRSHPTWDLSHLARRLRDRQHRLVELAAGQRSVTAALDLSYQDLNADLRRMYRLLGLHFGADIEPYAAAALLDASMLEAGRLLEQLLEAHLLQEPVPGRYRFHDLVRAHAAQTAARDETDDGRRVAVDRLLDYYRHTASVAMDTVYPYERDRRPPVAPVHTPQPVLSAAEPALSWLDIELSNLLTAATFATEHDRSAHLWQLSAILHRHLRSHGQYHDAVTLHQQALTTARATGDQAAELEALNGLGHIHRLHGRYEQASDDHGHALRLARATGHRAAELNALNGLGHTHRKQGRHERASHHYRQALPLARAIGDHTGELDALVGLGHYHLLRGRHERAVEHLYQTLRLARAIGHHVGEVNALNSLGNVHRRQGLHERAADSYQQAAQLARVNGNRVGERAALAGLGYVRRMQGQYEQASDHFQRLLDLALESGDRNYQFEAWQGLGRLRHDTGNPEAAITHHHQALTLATELGQPDDEARAHDGLARAHHTLHRHERARTHWQHALDIFTRLGTDFTDEEETTAAAIRDRLANLDERERAAPAD